jgi:2-polyprenyl-6-methoxyphenol hydroxylase-like FAD-dependent oxidoreductase
VTTPDVLPDVLIAGAGIGGLTAALAIARQDLPVTLFDQTERLEEAGAGIQLSPNATRVLIALGLADNIAPTIVVPTAIRLRAGSSGRDIATMPLGEQARHSAPYWVVHRADLQSALLAAVESHAGITLKLGARIDGFVTGPQGVAAKISGREGTREQHGRALIGADGLWSRLRDSLGPRTPARFAGRTAWRALAPSADVPRAFREPEVNLWIGQGGHLVHYPIRGGTAVNIVAVTSDDWQSTQWSTAADRDEVLARFPAQLWVNQARELLAAPERWQKWALYDRAPSTNWGHGPVTLLGDAAHPMLPFLAQGAAMAIEDAFVLAGALARLPGDPARALRDYEKRRQPRTARVQRAARRNDLVYHLGLPAAFVRDAALAALGGRRLLAQYDWIYRWSEPAQSPR